MLYTRETVKDNIRNREGKRVFYLASGDKLTPGAREYLADHGVQILSADQAKPEEYRLVGGGYIREKPEYMTHLNGDILVMKTHPRIAFRGAMDTLQAEIILCQLNLPEKIARALGEVLELSRQIIACEVLEQPLPQGKLLGLTPEELRSRSHRPQDYYGQTHFMPEATDGTVVVYLNRCRCAVRAAELAACRAFTGDKGSGREDILQALNRMSSAVYLLMVQTKAGER